MMNSEIMSYKTSYKGMFYSVQYPICWPAQRALHFTPWPIPVHSGTNSTSSHAAITGEDYSLTFPPLSIGRHSFMVEIELWRYGENGNVQSSK